MALTQAIVVTFLIGMVSSQVPFLGDCPHLAPMENFNMSRYMGRWYEVERYLQFYQFFGKCVSVEYTEDDDNIQILSRQINPWTQVSSEIHSDMLNPKANPQAVLVFKYPLAGIVPYSVLYTDYDNFSVGWSCSSARVASFRNLWIMTRERGPSLEVMDRAYEFLDKYGISKAYLFRTDQSSCPKYDASIPVEIEETTVTNSTQQ